MRPFQLTAPELASKLDEMVDRTFADLQSQFLVLPKGKHYVEYRRFQEAYEVLKRHTAAFSAFSEESVWSALRENSLVFVVLRTMLGVSPPEWAELVRSERGIEVDQNKARQLDVLVRHRGEFVRLLDRARSDALRQRLSALVSVAVEFITKGASPTSSEAIHRLAKADTETGVVSIQHAANHHVPYSVLLYERYLGRPFASHRDSVSELVGEVMENAEEERLTRFGISYRKPRRAERVPGFDQAPDFFVPDEFAPQVLIEAKITSDDGTARDKVARIKVLAGMRNALVRERRPDNDVFQLVACIDGRGFGVRRQDMRDLLVATEGKVFTLSTLDQMIPCTTLRTLVTLPRLE